jgi:hypothetical protein
MRRLSQLLDSGSTRERNFARHFLDAYGAKKPQDRRWRLAQARWVEMVNAELRDSSIDEEEAEKRAIDVLLTLVSVVQTARKI